MSEHSDNSFLIKYFQTIDESYRFEDGEDAPHTNSKLVKKRKKWDEKYADYLGIDSLITITPYYTKKSERKGTNYLGAEIMQMNYSEIVLSNSEKVGLENEMLNPLFMGDGDVTKFNDLAIINEWMVELVQTSERGMIPLTASSTKPIISKYGTSKIYYTGIMNSIIRKYWVDLMSYSVLGAVVWPLLPMVIYYVANPAHETLMFNLVLDMENSSIDFVSVDYFEKQMDAAIFIDSQSYSRLYYIKNSPKKPRP